MSKDTSPYVFLSQGDISWIQADLLVIPTSSARQGTGGVYKAVTARLSESERAEFKQAFSDKGRARAPLWKHIPGIRRPSKAIVVETLTGDKATVKSVGAAVTKTMEELGSHLPNNEKRTLVAMPAYGSGKGTGQNASELAVAQLKQLKAELKKRPDANFDVVVVLPTPASYARFVHARRGVFGGPPSATPPPMLGDRVKNERVVLFVGAGVSRGAGLPDWHQLMEKFVEKDPGIKLALLALRADKPSIARVEQSLRESSPTLPEGLTPDDYADLAKLFLERQGTDVRDEVINQCFSEEATSKRPPALAQYLLLQMPFRYVVTTNFDTFVERTLQDLGRSRSVVVADSEVAGSGEPGQVSVFKIHGTAKSGERPVRDIVLTTEEFGAFDKQSPAKAALLQALLLNHHFLFVGYSHGDENLNTIRKSVGEMLKGTKRKAWAIELEDVPKEEAGIEWVTLKDPRQLDIWLDQLAASTADVQAAFLADEIWSAEDSRLAPIHKALRELADHDGVLAEALDRKDEWKADEVRVLATVFTALADLGWRKSKGTGARHEWWKALAKGAERNEELGLALRLWRRALADASDPTQQKRARDGIASVMAKTAI